MALNTFPRALLLTNLLIWSSLLITSNGLNITIEEGPLSLLLPSGQIGTFSCKARCIDCLGYWIINNNVTSRNKDYLEAMGFSFSDIYSPETNQHNMTMTVNASEIVNGSKIQCRYSSTSYLPESCETRSNEATLLVIANSPVTPNPTIQNNATHITLLWSPPFLWPGQRIHNYSVILTTEGKCTISDHWTVNSNFSDQTVSFAKRNNYDGSPMCTEYEFYISAISVTSQQLPTFNVTGWANPSNLSGIEYLRIINISVYFTANGEPAMIEVYIQIPTCHSLPLSYTISLGDVMIESGQFRYQQSGFNIRVVNEIIKAELQVNRSYMLNVTTKIYSPNVQASDQWIFNTSLPVYEPCNTTEKVLLRTGESRDLISYRVTVVVFGLFIVFLLFSALISVIFCIYWSQRLRKKKCVNSKNRVQKGMVDNPIYVGGNVPVYDSIMTQPERIQSAGSDQKDTCITNPHYESLHVPNSKEMADTDRYIGQPTSIQPRKDLCFGSSLANSQSEIVCVRCISNSTSVSATTMSGLKSNGQPRNKLGLILSLDPCNPVLGDNAQSRMHTVQNSVTSDKLEEEAYAIMNPARPFLQTGYTESMKKRRE